jgi:hypothetical protein
MFGGYVPNLLISGAFESFLFLVFCFWLVEQAPDLDLNQKPETRNLEQLLANPI